MTNSYVEMMSAAQAIDMSVKMAFVVVEVLVVMVDLVKSANWLVVMALNLLFIFLITDMSSTNLVIVDACDPLLEVMAVPDSNSCKGSKYLGILIPTFLFLKMFKMCPFQQKN